jgi:hypothetical protein
MGPWTVVTPDWDFRPTATAGRAGGGARGQKVANSPLLGMAVAPGQAWTPPSSCPMSRRPAAESGGRLHRLMINSGEALLASEVAHPPPSSETPTFCAPPAPNALEPLTCRFPGQ